MPVGEPSPIIPLPTLSPTAEPRLIDPSWLSGNTLDKDDSDALLEVLKGVSAVVDPSQDSFDSDGGP